MRRGDEMWLIITFLAAVGASAAYLGFKSLRKYSLSFLALMLWGAFIMVLVDHVMAFVHEGGGFIEVTTDGLVADAAILGILMVVPLLAIWAIAVSTRFGDKIWIG